MQNIDYHLTGFITEYLESHEQICFKFVNKYNYEIFKKLSVKIPEPSFRNNIPLNIVYWLIDNLKFSEKFQSSCCTRLCFEKEYYKFGPVPGNAWDLAPIKEKNNDEYIVKFWEWMKENSNNLRVFNILGGEPLQQTEFKDCIDFFNTYPNP